MAAVVEMSKHLSPDEKIWRAMVYVGFYNVPAAEAMWREFPRYPGMGFIRKYMDQHWDGFKFRKARRTVRSPERFEMYTQVYPQLPDIMKNARDWDFEEVWELANELPHIGRYAALKLTEVWQRLGLTSAVCPDMRAEGGWSPREALKVLFPEVKHDPKDDSQRSIDQAEELGAHVFKILYTSGLEVSMLETEVMLCNYKAYYSTKRHYPGRPLDSELGYELALREYWKVENTDHLRVRPLVSPAWALGELSGWSGERPELGHTLSKYGYVWSDSLYDWHKTEDLSKPVRKS